MDKLGIIETNTRQAIHKTDKFYKFYEILDKRMGILIQKLDNTRQTILKTDKW